MSSAREVDNAAEAGDEVTCHHGKAVKAEVGKVGIGGSLLMAGEKATAEGGIVVAGDRPGQRQPRTGQGVTAFTARSDQEERGAGVALQIPRMGGEIGEEQDRLTGGRRRHRHQRDERTAVGIERTKACSRGEAEDVPGGWRLRSMGSHRV